MDYSKITPKKSIYLKISGFDNNERLIHQTNLNYRLAIDDKSFTILELVDNKNNIICIANKFHEIYGIEISPKVVYSVLKNKFEGFGIVTLDENFRAEPKKVEIHLRLSFIIISERLVNKITKFLVFLFYKKTFYCLSAFCISLILITIFSNISILLQKLYLPLDKNLFYFIVLSEFASFFHEFGHATACKKFGAKPGGIGFGFYYIIPVLFSDVSDAWKLDSNKRIIINLAGIYFEVIISTISLLIFFITSIDFFLIFPILLLLDTLHNLNPFLKFDGYWILSDLLKIPNLHRTANKTFIKFIKKEEINFSSRKKWFLIIYEILSKCYIFLIMTILLSTNYNYIIKFPLNVYNYFLYQIGHSEIPFNFSYAEFLLPFIFYFLLIRLLISILLNKLKKKLSVIIKANQ